MNHLYISLCPHLSYEWHKTRIKTMDKYCQSITYGRTYNGFEGGQRAISLHGFVGRWNYGVHQTDHRNPLSSIQGISNIHQSLVPQLL